MFSPTSHVNTLTKKRFSSTVSCQHLFVLGEQCFDSGFALCLDLTNLVNFHLLILRIRRMIVTPLLLVQKKNFFLQNINIWSFEHILIRKSEPTKFSRLCTFIIGSVHEKRCCQADQAAPCPSFAATNASARGQPGPQVIELSDAPRPPSNDWSCRWCPTAPSASSKLSGHLSHSQLLLCTLILSNYRWPRIKKSSFCY